MHDRCTSCFTICRHGTKREIWFAIRNVGFQSNLELVTVQWRPALSFIESVLPSYRWCVQIIRSIHHSYNPPMRLVKF